jgi:hypothetical protein
MATYCLATLPQHAVVHVGEHLPLRSAVALSRTCKGFRDALPSILRRHDTSYATRLLMEPRIDETQLASIASWMRVYDARLVVCSPRAALGANACATVERWVALIRQFARLPAHWAPARWAEIDGAWTRNGPNDANPDCPARWLRLDLSPTYHPDTVLEASGGILPRTQFQTMVIETARLNRAFVTDDLVATLGNVHTLDLRYTGISDVSAFALGKSRTLHTLDVRGTKITDVGASALRNVRSLNVSETSVTDAAVLALAPGSVHTLDLSETGVTDVAAIALSESRALHTLSLRGTRITDVGVGALGSVRTLHTLDLCGTRVTDVGAAALGNSKIHTLNVFRTGITGVGAAALRNVHTLELPRLARIAAAEMRVQEIVRAQGHEATLLRTWVDATFTRVPFCEKSTGTNIRALYAAYVCADPPVHATTLSQISFAHMLREVYDFIGPRPILASPARHGARRLCYVYLLRSRQ